MSRASLIVAEHDLVELVRVGQELVVVDLDDERNVVRVLARHRAEHAEGRRDGVAAALDGELDDVLRVEVGRVRRERRAGGVLDALVDRQNRQIAGVGQPAGRRTAAAGCGAPASAGPTTRRSGRRSRGPAGASDAFGTLAVCDNRFSASFPNSAATFVLMNNDSSTENGITGDTRARRRPFTSPRSTFEPSPWCRARQRARVAAARPPACRRRLTRS